ncbi:MAG: hypothetical protein ACE5SW_12400 [Nitrososphaeraceae archaeon]
MQKISKVFLIVLLPLLLVSIASNFSNTIQYVLAQNTVENTDKKVYVLLFEQNKLGNIDNSTKIVSAIVGDNLIKIEEELLEELSLAPSQQLVQDVSDLINNATSGLKCNKSIITQEGENVRIECVSIGKYIIWDIYPN